MDLLLTLDWAALLKIIGIDIMLGVDNALVITLAHAHHLPAQLAGALLVIGLALRTHGQRRTEATA